MDKYKIKSGIIGLITGDALGVPVEMKKRVELDANPVTDMIGYGTWNQPAGTWSDDSSLTLCLIESLINDYEIEDIGEKFAAWYKDGLWTPHGKNFGTGKSTTDAIEKILNGENPLYLGSSDERSNGNGSLMRILPLAYFLKNSCFEERAKIISEVSAITHTHRRSILACEIYIDFAINLLNGFNKDSAYNNMKFAIKNYYSNDAELHTYSKIIEENISNFSRNDISATPYVVHTLEAALWCFMKFDSYKDVVLNAVNLGQDADTTAAVAGGLAGIYYGVDNIPKEWIDKLAKIDEIVILLEKYEEFLSLCPAPTNKYIEINNGFFEDSGEYLIKKFYNAGKYEKPWLVRIDFYEKNIINDRAIKGKQIKTEWYRKNGKIDKVEVF